MKRKTIRKAILLILLGWFAGASIVGILANIKDAHPVSILGSFIGILLFAAGLIYLLVTEDGK
jgi:formate/nitrite transporter FocA (FNT family)